MRFTIVTSITQEKENSEIKNDYLIKIDWAI